MLQHRSVNLSFVTKLLLPQNGLLYFPLDNNTAAIKKGNDENCGAIKKRIVAQMLWLFAVFGQQQGHHHALLWGVSSSSL